MKIFVIIFTVVSVLTALTASGGVVADIVIEKRELSKGKRDKDAAAEKPEQLPSAEEHEVPEEEIMPEPVEQVSAEEADEMISDELAMNVVKRISGAGVGKQGIVNIGDIDGAFEPYSVVTLEALKEKGLVSKNVGRLKVLADGRLHKPLTVKAEHYSVQAVKMIELTGGEVIILKD